MHDPADTIVALASAAGPGARAVVRLSGPDAIRIAQAVFTPATDPTNRSSTRGQIRLPELASPLPAELLVWPAPRTYTGQEMAELHTVSSPPLLDLLVAQLLNTGARAAQPGEFTLRAFLAGKRDLPRAEAVQAVVAAGDRAELTQALAQLAGGVTQPLAGLRDDMLNLLADVEAALDFSDEDVEFVGRDDMLLRLSSGMARITNLRRQLDQRAAASDRPFRAVLVGEPNAGKSSLFNALGGVALVSPLPGTTRDYLTQRLEIDGILIELIDTAGRQEVGDAIQQQAQDLAAAQARNADLRLLCVEAGRPAPSAPGAVIVRTKSDLRRAPPGSLATSAVTGAGLRDLKSLLV
ncbi:MAG: tRNA modification GTPase, partial [Gemmataceae bacterium]